MSFIDPSACKEILDSCYAIPVWDVEMMMTKCNVHPFTTMRAPGHTQVGGGVVWVWEWCCVGVGMVACEHVGVVWSLGEHWDT